MAAGLNKVHLIGNLGGDPELKGNSTAVLKFNMATTETFLDSNGDKKENTQWHRVAVFGKRGEALEKILHKGSQIFVEGRIENGSYEDKDGNKKYTSEIIATNIVLLGKREDSDGDRGGGRDRDDDRGRDRGSRGGDRDRGGDRGSRGGGDRAESRGSGNGGGGYGRGGNGGGNRDRGNDRGNSNRRRDNDGSDDFGGGGNDDDIPFMPNRELG